jgi:hypothetical protein
MLEIHEAFFAGTVRLWICRMIISLRARRKRTGSGRRVVTFKWAESMED